MADTIRRAEYVHVAVSDEPGEGARVLEKLKGAGINLLAVHAFPTGSGTSQLDLVAPNADALVRAAQAAGITLSPRKTVFQIEGPDRPGAVAELLGRLADAKINARALDAVCAGGRFGALLWVQPKDVERAAEALGSK